MNYPPNTTLPLTVVLFDTVPLTGKTVVGSVRRDSDAKYWTGAAWQDTYATVSFTEKVVDNDHEKGSYVHSFTTGIDVYEVVVRYSEVGYSRLFRSFANTLGNTLSATGLTLIDETELTTKPTNFQEWVRWLIYRFRRTTFNMSGGSGTLLVQKPSDGATVTTQVLAESTSQQTTGEPT